MNLVKILATVLFLTPACAFSQEQKTDLAYFLGKNLKYTNLGETVTYTMPLSNLAAAPYIQMTYKNHDYAITSYTVSIMSRKFAKVVGQLKQQQGSIVESAAKMDYTLSTGDRIFIEDLGAFCGKCTGDKNISTKGMVILIE